MLEKSSEIPRVCQILPWPFVNYLKLVNLRWPVLIGHITLKFRYAVSLPLYSLFVAYCMERHLTRGGNLARRPVGLLIPTRPKALPGRPDALTGQVRYMNSLIPAGLIMDRWIFVRWICAA
jgi:hypothetical protein